MFSKVNLAGKIIIIIVILSNLDYFCPFIKQSERHIHYKRRRRTQSPRKGQCSMSLSVGFQNTRDF